MLQIRRHLEPTLVERLRSNAAVALIGPRQIGKTTMALDVADTWPEGAVYLDLERPADRRRLDAADSYLRAQAPRLVVLDEVHRMPDIFEILRGVIDDNRRSTLGRDPSPNRDSESSAVRVSVITLVARSCTPWRRRMAVCRPIPKASSAVMARPSVSLPFGS